MPRLNLRRGASLAEMIVALTLAAIISAAGATALAGTERYMRRVRETSDARRMIREAKSVLASELLAVSSDSLRVRGDTAVDFLGLVGVSVVCASQGTVLVLPPDAAGGGYPYSSWRATPEPGDIVAVFDTARGGRWRTAVVDTATSRTDGAGCKPSTGLLSVADSIARRPVTRVVLQTTFDSTVAIVGAPLRVLRSARYALTRAADGSWSLSYRRCTGTSCGVAQPVAGPFASPGDSGVTFTYVASESRLVAALRARPAAPGAGAEFGVLRIALRNSTTGVP
jgi:hypothetical protein